MYVYMYICMYVIVYVCMYIRIFVCVCVCLYECIIYVRNNYRQYLYLITKTNYLTGN